MGNNQHGPYVGYGTKDLAFNPITRISTMIEKPFLPVTIIILILAILFAGCTEPAPVPETGSIQVTSSPSGAEVYLDNEFHGTTPVSISSVVAGDHIVEVRLTGHTRWSGPVTVTAGSTVTIPIQLTEAPAAPPVTVTPTIKPAIPAGIPQVHVDGYWAYPEERGSTTTNPVRLLVHTEAFNVGSGDAREVTVSANFYLDGRMICWNTVYLGTLPAGGHTARDSMVTCSLPSTFDSPDLTVRFENIAIKA